MVESFNVGMAALWMPLIPQAPPPPAPSHFTELLIVVHLTHTHTLLWPAKRIAMSLQC